MGRVNPLLLSHWLPLCERASVPFVPITVGPAVPLDEIQRAIEGLGRTPKLERARLWVESKGAPPRAMWRWDCCSAPDLKDASEEGLPSGPPKIDMDLDDERFLAIIEELERADVTELAVVARPWVAAKREAGFPVELRAFVSPKGVAVSCYHAARPLPVTYLEDARKVVVLATRLASVSPVTSFTADFLLDESGELFFLEGGPGWDRRGLVDTCCFEGEPRPGQIALARGAGHAVPDRNPGPRAVPPAPGKLGLPTDKVAAPVRRSARPMMRSAPIPPGKVGIFWLHGGKLIVFGEEASTVKPVGGVRDGRFGHDDEWPNVQEMYPALVDREYFEIPRGRVLFREDPGVYEVFLPAKLHAHKRLVEAVAKAFSLQPEGIRLKQDEHYELEEP
jgi:hypothetical protein